MTWTVVGVTVLILIGIGVLMTRGYFDRRRVEDYAQAMGLKVLRIDRPAMPKFGEYSDRIYSVDIEEADGTTKTIHCLTAWSIGTHIVDESTDPLRIKFPKPSRAR